MSSDAGESPINGAAREAAREENAYRRNRDALLAECFSKPPKLILRSSQDSRTWFEHVMGIRKEGDKMERDHPVDQYQRALSNHYWRAAIGESRNIEEEPAVQLFQKKAAQWFADQREALAELVKALSETTDYHSESMRSLVRKFNTTTHLIKEKCLKNPLKCSPVDLLRLPETFASSLRKIDELVDENTGVRANDMIIMAQLIGSYGRMVEPAFEQMKLAVKPYILDAQKAEQEKDAKKELFKKNDPSPYRNP